MALSFSLSLSRGGTFNLQDFSGTTILLKFSLREKLDLGYAREESVIEIQRRGTRELEFSTE